MSRYLWISLLLLALISQVLDAKGSFGGGRGSSGARSSSFSSSGSRSSSSFGSSSSSSGYRSTGTSSYSSRSGGASSYGSSSSPSSYSSRSTGTSSYRGGNAQYNSNFRQNLFTTTTTSTTFSYSPLTHSHVIISPITPIYFGSYHYYWGGHYVHDSARPQQCDYTITEDDQELKNVTFSNGTKATTLTFGCKSSQSCCGLECCGGDSTWITVILIIVGIVAIIIICSWCSKKGYCENETVVVTSVPVIATTTTTHTYSTPSGPPPPPGFHGQNIQQFGPPPNGQPVYAPPPEYNNYEQNSPYGGRPLSSSQIQTHYKC